jgi:c(7)-type cytochrome triheme protein
MTLRTYSKWAAIVAVALVAGFATGGELKRLPADEALPMGEGSPGKVVFSHQTHVDADKPRCAGCHPVYFRILQKASTASGARITHDGMEKQKQACGACHGKTAFGFDDCTMCHRS